MVASDELRELRLQVDQLRERLDFMAPMLSLLSFTQDYCQSLECEASVQLLRLKSARLSAADPVPLDRGAAKEQAAQHPVETARWLHAMTDLVLGLASGGALASVRQEPVEQGPAQLMLEARARPALQTLAHSPMVSPRDAHADQAEAPRRPGTFGRGGVLFGAKASPPARPGPMRAAADRLHTAFENLRAGQSSPARTRGSPSVEAVSPLDSTLEFGGLALGRGSWANAYRQATGARREALRLLCTLGIVTERELADDLTVIDEEHIDECVSIAAEMLLKWTPELGPPPQQEAKSFFEERLAALYMKRAPSPFGLG